MKIIEGFEQAKSELSREVPIELYPVSSALRQRLKEIFDTDDPEVAVRQVINEVRSRGDTALFDLTLKVDGITEVKIDREFPNTAFTDAFDIICIWNDFPVIDLAVFQRFIWRI